MSTTVRERSFDFEQLFYQAAVDHEFRAELLDNPRVFGMNHDNVLLPNSVEPQDHVSSEFWSEGMAVMECVSSCSFGPITAICDGTTK